MSTVAAWSPSDLAAAVASIVADTERCSGCGMTADDAWWVEAELTKCPTCEDRDRKLEALSATKTSRAGYRVAFTMIADPDESAQFSSAAKYTLAGAEARARRRQTQVARQA